VLVAHAFTRVAVFSRVPTSVHAFGYVIVPMVTQGMTEIGSCHLFEAGTAPTAILQALFDQTERLKTELKRARTKPQSDQMVIYSDCLLCLRVS
jgi:hypothetical protein